MLPVDPSIYGAYLGVMAVMAITPGPANLFAIATGVRAGPRAALLGVVGMNLASLVWYVGAAAGLMALVRAYPRQFHVIALAGGAYVSWLGLSALWTAATARDDAPAASPIGVAASPRPARALRDGFLVQIANPKALLFFAAILPAFIDPARPALAQLVWFGAATLVMDVAAMSAYGLAGGALSAALTSAGARRVFNIVVGVLLLLAAALIVARA